MVCYRAPLQLLYGLVPGCSICLGAAATNRRRLWTILSASPRQLLERNTTWSLPANQHGQSTRYVPQSPAAAAQSPTPRR